jgi:cytoskeletal protein CcmA (bactofilin family)
MGNRKIDQLPQFSGDTSGVHIVINNPSNTTTHTVTKEILLDGNNTFHGNQVISGSLEITGTTTLGGNIVPKTARGATLGTLSNPFADIYVSSGSINIAGVPGQPNTTLSNVSGNILISAGGMQLVGSGAFNAATGSFQFISGSMEQIGNYTQTGNYVMNGNKTITGSLKITGSGFINSHRILTDLDSGSFNVTISGNTNDNVLTATGQANTLQGESNLKFDGTNLNLTGSAIVNGNVNVTGSAIVNGNVIVTGSLIMDSTLQTNISHTVTNPSNYVLHQFLTSSYHGATYAFSAHNDSTGKVTVYSNYIVAQGANSINSNIGGDSKVTSGGGAPNPAFAVGFSGSYAQFKVTDTGTFTYRGIVQLY